MLAPAHCFAPKVSQPQRFPLPAATILCAERSILEVVPAKAWLAAIAGQWLAYQGRAAMQIVSAERSMLELLPLKMGLAAASWPAWQARAATQVLAQPIVLDSPASWISRVYVQPAAPPGGVQVPVIGSSIFCSSVFGSSVLDRTPLDEEEV